MKPVLKHKLTSLPSDLSAHLLQGVPLSTCLSGCGQHWAPPSKHAQSFYGERTYCQKTERYDVFLSHDWGTSRWLKLSCLVMMFNVRAASILSLLVAVIVGLLRVYGAIPDQKWTEIIPMLTFYGVLAFWQQIRERFKRPLVVFLDRLCIAQHDDRLKEQGILGLAGFLDRSRILAVLWSPRYFKRLWCTYELATFLRKPGKEKSIRIMPVMLAPALLTFSVCWQVIRLAHDTACEYFDHDGSINWLMLGGVLLFLIFSSAPIYMYVGMGLVRDLQCLPDHLQSFKIQDAECFCCTNNHRHPSTGEELPCDRRLIFRTLQKWYGTPEEDGEGHLETFNSMVRSRLYHTVWQTVGGHTLPLQQYLFITLGSNAPALVDYISRIAAGPEPPAVLDSDYARFVWGARWMVRWMNISLQMLFGMWISIASWKLGVRLMRYYSRVLLALTLPYLVYPFVLAVAWLPIRICFDLTPDSSLVPVIPFLTLLAITLCLFSAGASPKTIAPDLSELEQRPSRSSTFGRTAAAAWEGDKGETPA